MPPKTKAHLAEEEIGVVVDELHVAGHAADGLLEFADRQTQETVGLARRRGTVEAPDGQGDGLGRGDDVHVLTVHALTPNVGRHQRRQLAICSRAQRAR